MISIGGRIFGNFFRIVILCMVIYAEIDEH